MINSAIGYNIILTYFWIAFHLSDRVVSATIANMSWLRLPVSREKDVGIPYTRWFLAVVANGYSIYYSFFFFIYFMFLSGLGFLIKQLNYETYFQCAPILFCEYLQKWLQNRESFGRSWIPTDKEKYLYFFSLKWGT